METQTTPLEPPEARLKVLENQELESPRGVLTSELYAEFLALCLLTNDLANAKFLWKRIPDETKSESDELKAVWEIGKAAWKRDYNGVQMSISSYEWTEKVKQILDEYKVKMREHCLSLVASGYTNVKLDFLANMLGLAEKETIDIVSDREWSCDADTKIVTPKKKRTETECKIINEEHIHRLTQHILFLET